ncbi:MAG TPA: hypothetical protein VGM90_33825 [Kofleriaceae bacterium]
MIRSGARALPLAALVFAACGDERPSTPPIRFLHTFSPAETELFNTTIAERGVAVESSLVPFARGQQVINEILAAGGACPDLIRIDATWLPGLRAQLVPPPPELQSLDWTPEAAMLAQLDGAWWGVPQTVDGLIVIRDAATPPPASSSVADLVNAARAAKSEGRRYPLAVRVDGYWLLPWLRSEGADLAPDGIAGDNATHAMSAFAALYGDVAAPPPPAGSEAPDESRRWGAHEVAYWITGPWQLGALRDPERVAVSAIEHAPRGGQLLVVPKCAPRPADGWKLAGEITSVPFEATLSNAFRTVPTRQAALAQAPALAQAAATALKDASPLPRTVLTPLLFDDLNPALSAVVAGDATADEAIAGVRRGWSRIEKGSR